MIARLMGLQTVDPATLRRRMQSERIAIFDVNSLGSWRNARVPGARHLDPATGISGWAAAGLPTESGG